MFARRSRIPWPLLLAFVAYTAGMVRYVHVCLEEGHLASCQTMDVPSSTAHSAESGSPVAPAHKHHCDHDCPICQVLLGMSALPYAGPAILVLYAPLVDRLSGAEQRAPAWVAPATYSARAPPSSLLS